MIVYIPVRLGMLGVPHPILDHDPDMIFGWLDREEARSYAGGVERCGIIELSVSTDGDAEITADWMDR